MNAMDAITFIAERKIEEALAEGAFDNLPGLGKPLQLDDLSHMPPDMRMAYTILKNSGYLEEPAEAKKPASMRELLSSVPEEGRAYAKIQRLNLMMTHVRRAEIMLIPERAGNMSEEEAGNDYSTSPYLEKLVERV